jgi:hypothetical protein
VTRSDGSVPRTTIPHKAATANSRFSARIHIRLGWPTVITTQVPPGFLAEQLGNPIVRRVETADIGQVPHSLPEIPDPAERSQAACCDNPTKRFLRVMYYREDRRHEEEP